MRIATCFLLFAASAAFAANNKKIAPDVNTGGEQSVDVIVRYRALPQQAHEHAVENRGGRVKGRLHLINSVVYSVPSSALEGLADDPDVEYITPDRAVHAMLDYAQPAINAGIAFNYGYTGNGVTVASSTVASWTIIPTCRMRRAGAV